ncbi:MAG: S-layer homology domain-containing protein, partial [Clostridia bacterium]|nr:S-layer homology domain-containing protein [Clostridia bacterium]
MMFDKKTLTGLILAGLMTLSATAAFQKTNTYAENQFTDVPTSEWYASEVKNTFELGLMNGKGAGIFEPEGNVTVAEAITMASRAASIYAGETIPAAGGEWYQMYVNYAMTKGFVKDGQFDNFDRPAKRYEVASLFENAMPDGYFTAKNAVDKIPDVSVSKA